MPAERRVGDGHVMIHAPPLLLSSWSICCGGFEYTTGFVIVHERFLSLFRNYLQSHFVPAFEILILLVVS